VNSKRFFQKSKNIYHLTKSVLASFWFGFPSKKLKVVGVTGTNGKTTTVQMIGKVLEATGKKVAVYSTINFKIGGKEEVNKTKFTTGSAWGLQKFIKRSVEAGCDYLVLETSSHSLDQFRVWGVDFDIAVVTNVTREHLDYHFTMKDYRQAKLKLFRKTANSWWKDEKIGVVNCGMENFKDFFFPRMTKNFFYGIDCKNKSFRGKPVWRADNIQIDEKGSKFEVDGFKFSLKLLGKFNIENALAAICIGVSQGLPMNKIAGQLKKIENVPGRMEFVKNKLGLKVIIDYALTPDSMEKLGEMMKEMKKNSKGRLIWVFGSCGDRDRGKRPIMGEIVSKFADLIITTNEDPYSEDPVRIIEEIEAGIKNKKKLTRVVDRKKALKKAFEMAEKGDIVLVTGKGAEENMMVGAEKIPWNDRKVIERILG